MFPQAAFRTNRWIKERCMMPGRRLSGRDIDLQEALIYLLLERLHLRA
jgi:hypothetical protein